MAAGFKNSDPMKSDPMKLDPVKFSPVRYDAMYLRCAELRRCELLAVAPSRRARRPVQARAIAMSARLIRWSG